MSDIDFKPVGMAEWEESYRLDEIADVIDCEHKTAPRVDESNFYSIRTPDIKNGRLLIDQSYRVSEETYNTWIKRGTPETGDIILAREAPIGEVGFVKENYKVCLGQRTVLIKVKSEFIDKRFLLYSFVAPSFKQLLNDLSGGSVVSHLNMKDIRALNFIFPPLPEQRAIASVLTSLDDKIDLLHRQNKTLEAMAETLFRQWFVEEAGEDWEEKKLGELVTVKRGGSPRPIQDYLSDSGYRWLKISDVTSLNTPFIFDIKEHIKIEGLSKTTLLSAGKLVLSNSATPAIPKILMVDSCIHDGWLHFPKSYFSNEYLYLLFNHIRPELLQQGNGSIFTNLKTDILKEFVVKLPPQDKLLDFQELVAKIFRKLLSNTKQIKTVEKLRDNLLPKLMSGEVRVDCALR